MTNPRDPWQRPDSPDAPTEYIGAPGSAGPADQHHTQPTTPVDAANWYGHDPANPHQYFEQPPGPNATREIPAYETQRWGDYEPGYGQPAAGAWQPPGPGPVGPTGLPIQPRRRRTGLWLAVGAAVFVLVVLGGIAAGLLLAGHGDSTSTAASGTAHPIPSAVPLPRTSGAPLPSLPSLPGLGDIDGIGATMGTIFSNDGGTLTLQSLRGTTVTVHTDAKTQVIALGAVTLADLHPGDMVVVQGDKSADGSIMAKLIVGASMSR